MKKRTFRLPENLEDYKRRPSATEDAKRRAYEEFFGRPKPDNEPELAAQLATYRSVKVRDALNSSDD